MSARSESFLVLLQELVDEAVTAEFNGVTGRLDTQATSMGQLMLRVKALEAKPAPVPVETSTSILAVVKQLNHGQKGLAAHYLFADSGLNLIRAGQVIDCLVAGAPDDLEEDQMNAYNRVIAAGFKVKVESTGVPPRPYLKQVVQALGEGDTKMARSILFDNTNLTQMGAELVTQALLAGSPDGMDDNVKRVYSLIVEAGFKVKVEPESELIPIPIPIPIPVYVVSYELNGDAVVSGVYPTEILAVSEIHRLWANRRVEAVFSKCFLQLPKA